MCYRWCLIPGISERKKKRDINISKNVTKTFINLTFSDAFALSFGSECQEKDLHNIHVHDQKEHKLQKLFSLFSNSSDFIVTNYQSLKIGNTV